MVPQCYEYPARASPVCAPYSAHVMKKKDPILELSHNLPIHPSMQSCAGPADVKGVVHFIDPVLILQPLPVIILHCSSTPLKPLPTLHPPSFSHCKVDTRKGSLLEESLCRSFLPVSLHPM